MTTSARQGPDRNGVVLIFGLGSIDRSATLATPFLPGVSQGVAPDPSRRLLVPGHPASRCEHGTRRCGTIGWRERFGQGGEGQTGVSLQLGFIFCRQVDNRSGDDSNFRPTVPRHRGRTVP